MSNAFVDEMLALRRKWKLECTSSPVKLNNEVNRHVEESARVANQTLHLNKDSIQACRLF